MSGEIDKVFAGINTRLRRFKQEVGMETMSRTKQRTPVVSGEMQAGWGFEMKATDIEIYNVSDHAEYVEYGTEHMAPRAPLRTTLLEMDDIMKVALERASK
jgi:hypothetical protein